MKNQNGSPANSVDTKCIGAEREAAKNIVAKNAAKKHTGNGNEAKHDGRHGSIETQHIYVKTGFSRECDHCGREYVAKRTASKFCHSRCRVSSHRARGQRDAHN